MRVRVAFAKESVEFEAPEDRVLGTWSGPAPLGVGELASRVREALASPRGYPSLGQAVVPGDRVAIALDPSTPEPATVLSACCEILTGSGVEPGAIRVLAPSGPPEDWPFGLPAGVEWTVHDPDDRGAIAYLATTPQERRVYLNRHATDADFVLAVGPFGFDAVLGFRGPWSAIYPDLSDAETLGAYRSKSRSAARERWDARETLAESAEVSWLLGAQLQLGILEGSAGVADVVAGAEAEVQAEGHRLLEESWTFRPPGRAELVVVGIGGAGGSSSLETLADGLATASRLVRRGGRIVALSAAGGVLGPAVRRLEAMEDPGEAPGRLRGAEAEPDYPTARKLARALGRARVYLLSGLDEEVVEELGMIPLDAAAEGRRLVESAGSCVFVSRAEATRAVVTEPEDQAG